MKKTLVALAALAATGAFAQVSITGEFAYGFSTGTDAAGAEAGGFGVDTSQLWFKANEDLGGGYKAGVSMSLAGADRSGESTASTGNGNVTGRDAQLDLTTPFGLLSMGTKKNADYLNGVAGLGAIWYGLDGNIQASRTRRDQWTFAVPMGGLTLAFSQQEDAEKMGLGTGTTGAAGTTGQRLTVVAANYKSGALVADAQYLMFDSKASAGSKDNQVRLSGNYDLGVAKVGAGTTITTLTTTGRVTDLLVGVSVPMGATTLALNWASENTADTAALGTAEGTRSGYALQATYNLSKSTYFIAGYKRWDATVGAAKASTQSNLLLVKDF